jgi:heme oxygenase
MTTLRDAIHDLHHVAENTRFTKLLLSGGITPEAYSIFLQNLSPIYSQLEDHLIQNGFLKDIFSIQRAELIRQDIKQLSVFQDPVSLLKTTYSYLDHIGHIAKHNPNLLLAHLYIRHFGDMYGGQMIKKVVPGSGTMYEFENKKELIEKVRAMLTLDLADEANVAMQFAIDLFEELADELHI